MAGWPEKFKGKVYGYHAPRTMSVTPPSTVIGVDPIAFHRRRRPAERRRQQKVDTLEQLLYHPCQLGASRKGSSWSAPDRTTPRLGRLARRDAVAKVPRVRLECQAHHGLYEGKQRVVIRSAVDLNIVSTAAPWRSSCRTVCSVRPRTIPQQLAGLQIEPAPSVPSARGPWPDANCGSAATAGTTGRAFKVPPVPRKTE